ncbi:hypothetical protein ASG67_04465 [Sphingomonas sp. Leaf339]|uniref:DUF2842 domain-containing protein n=1 Tax=Sphingomonas sp. Leaf339 TaxID=1736343 RepID=UPI0006FB04E0|nr:DUF2842 domain-containing protein [Sphingomonas sp. Leaf339]KQU62348.1 hypothetical protein ASG67_04465 [Sphingomonas sp. Leaf339]
MTPSWRKPAGVLAILALITIWAVMVASMSDLVGGLHWAVQAMFYLVTGIVWITPMRPLLSWMETGRWR